MSEDEIENESLKKNSKIEDVDMSLNEVCKSVCKIITKNSVASGFLIKLYKEQKELYCLMTNEHVINKKMIESKDIINFYYNYEKEWKQLKLDTTQRFIKFDSEKDFTIIEIKPDDKIKEKYFLLPNINKINNINEEIYIVQFPEGIKLSSSKGKITEIENFQFFYDASTKHGSSGSPILLKNSIKVIGMHKGSYNAKKMNRGIQMYSIIELFQSNEEQNQLVHIEFWEDTFLYIGQSLNGKKHGKGKIFDQFGNEIYDGEFKNGEKEGKGRYNFKYGEYYIGDWVKGNKHGKGIIYSRYGVIIYEGDFVNDKKEGEGKYIDNNGKYYIGQFKNAKFSGKGKYFYTKDGKLEYEGDYVNGMKEGKGKYIYDNGDYYEGQFKNDKKHGKGILYDKNKNKIYEGEFFDGKKQGKGKLYYNNGKIKYEGDFSNDKEEGDGIYFETNGCYYIGQFKDGKKYGNGIWFDINGNDYNNNNNFESI